MAEKKKSFWERNKERNEEAMRRADALHKAKEEGKDVTDPEVNKQVQALAQDKIDKAKVEKPTDKVPDKVPEEKSTPTVKAEPKVSEPIEEKQEIVDEVSTTEEDAETTAESIKKDIENSGIMDTEEGQEAQAAIDSNKPEMLMNITTPEGKSVLKGSYDKNGNYVPYVYTEKDTRLVKNSGLAGALTIISYALSSLGVMVGIPILPVNFYKFGATPQEDLNRLQSVENGYAELMNAGKKEATETERKRTAEREANVADIDAYKGISDEDAQKAAQVNAAVSGSNTQMDVQGQAQEWQAKQAQLDRDFQEKMANINTENTIAIANANAANQQEMARLLNDQEVQKVIKKIEYAKEAGLSQDELAKWLRAEQGVTKLAAGLGYVSDGADAASKIADIFTSRAKSDKSVKSYIVGAKDANTKLLSNLWKGRK